MTRKKLPMTVEDMIIDRLDRIETKLDEKLDNHSKKIDKIEEDITKAKGWATGAVAIATLVISAALTFLKLR